MFINKKLFIFVNMREEQIILDALEQFEDRTGIQVKVTEPTTPEIDGIIHFTVDGRAHMAYLEVKKFVQPAQMAHITQLRGKYDPLMVVTEHIYPKLKVEMRRLGIAYLETNGNMYYKGRDILLWLDGQKRTAAAEVREKTGRAFTKTGLKLVFHFLLEPGLLDLTYREIAERTGVVFGNINVVMNDLKQQGFLIALDKNRFVLNNKKELLQRWMVGYAEKLKPALKLGNFQFLKEGDFLNWKQIPLTPMKTWWGAEPAADLFTDYLRPGELTLYTLETRQELIRNYRLVPDEKGPVKVYHKFWQIDEVNDKVVPPLLVYVDLVNTGERRCMETAKKIYEQFLQDKF